MKKRSQKSQNSDPVREDIRHLGVIIEDVQRQVYLLAEGQTALRQTVDDIKQTVDEHSKILDEHSRILAHHTQILNEHSKILDVHSKDLREIRHDLKRKVDYDEFFPWTKRVLVLEKKV